MTPFTFNYRFQPARLVRTIAAFQLLLGALSMYALYPQWSAHPEQRALFTTILIIVALGALASAAFLQAASHRLVNPTRADRVLMVLIAVLDFPLRVPLGTILSLTLLYLIWRTREGATTV